MRRQLAKSIQLLAKYNLTVGSVLMAIAMTVHPVDTEQLYQEKLLSDQAELQKLLRDQR